MHTRLLLFVIAIVVDTAACSGCDDRRTREELAVDLATWSALPDDAAMTAAAPALQSRWQGQVLRSEALATAGLCVTSSTSTAALTCAMNPFPRGGAAGDAAAGLGGKFPRYRFDGAAAAALRKRCRGLATCVVDVEASVAKLTLDPEQALALELDHVVIHGGRPQSAGEAWHRPPPALPQKHRPLPFKPSSPTTPIAVSARVF